MIVRDAALALLAAGAVLAALGIIHSVRWRTWRASSVSVALAVRCPVCVAAKGRPCRTTPGVIHGPRLALWLNDPNSKYLFVYEVASRALSRHSV